MNTCESDTHPNIRLEPIDQLTSLRFFAALSVLVSHYTVMGFLPVPESVIAFLDGGRPAVAFFFVLSGFVLTYNYAGKIGDSAGRKRYYWARAARIYPVHLLGLAIALAGLGVAVAAGRLPDLLSWFSVNPDHVGEMLGASFLAQLGLLTGWLPFAGVNQPWNGPTWSISCEAFFYATLPLILPLILSRTPKQLVLLVLLAWVTQGLLILGFQNFLPIGRQGFLINQFPLTHFFEFLLGAVTGRGFLRGRLQIQKYATTMLVVALAWICTLSALRPFAPAYYLLSPAFALLIVALASMNRGGGLANRWLVLLGEASFSLYILHVPIGNLARVLGLPNQLGWALFLGMIGLSILVFRFYEEPLRKAMRNFVEVNLPRPVSIKQS